MGIALLRHVSLVLCAVMKEHDAAGLCSEEVADLVCLPEVVTAFEELRTAARDEAVSVLSGDELAVLVREV